MGVDELELATLLVLLELVEVEGVVVLAGVNAMYPPTAMIMIITTTTTIPTVLEIAFLNDIRFGKIASQYLRLFRDINCRLHCSPAVHES